MDGSENSGTPKWMVYNGNPIKMDDLGVPLFSETPYKRPLSKGQICTDTTPQTLKIMPHGSEPPEFVALDCNHLEQIFQRVLFEP